MAMADGTAGPEVVLATSARAFALVDEHARAWRAGRRLPAHLLLGAACPACGRQVAALVARDRPAREALVALRAAGRCLHPDGGCPHPDGDGPAAPTRS